MNLSKRQILSLVFLLGVVFSIPIALNLVQKRQSNRPQALQGKANFTLLATGGNKKVGDNFDVFVSLLLTDQTLKVSGADFLLLYDKNKLDVVNIVPALTNLNPDGGFTDAPIVSSGGSFDNDFNFIRVAEVARRPATDLPPKIGSALPLARITFRAKDAGNAMLKFPDDNKYLEIVGTGTVLPPPLTPNPFIIPSQTGCVLSPVYTGDTCNGYRLITSLDSSSACYSYDQCGPAQGNGTCVQSPTYQGDQCNGYRVMAGVSRACLSLSQCQALIPATITPVGPSLTPIGPTAAPTISAVSPTPTSIVQQPTVTPTVAVPTATPIPPTATKVPPSPTSGPFYCTSDAQCGDGRPDPQNWHCDLSYTHQCYHEK